MIDTSDSLERQPMMVRDLAERRIFGSLTSSESMYT